MYTRGEKALDSEPDFDSHFGYLTREAALKCESRPMAVFQLPD